MFFAVAGIECDPFFVFAAAFCIAAFTSTAGVSGAFLLLPFQMEILGYTAPSVSATNHFFNIMACPAGVWRFWREGRLLIPLAVFIAIGTLPGVFLGAAIRATLLEDAQRFMLFASLVLAYIGLRLLFNKNKKNKKGVGAACSVLSFSIKSFTFEYAGDNYQVKSGGIILLSLFVGIVGGIYGIGGGGIISPILVSFYGLPIHAIAGACLFATFLTSILGALFFSLLALIMHSVNLAPDWLLGLILGGGGMAGMYLGASLQKYIPAAVLKVFLAALLLLAAINLASRSFGLHLFL